MGAPVEGRAATALGAIAGLALAPLVLLLFLMGECWAGEGGGSVTAVASLLLRRRSDSWASGLLATAAPALAVVAAYVVLALPSDTCSQEAEAREPAWRCDTDPDT